MRVLDLLFLAVSLLCLIFHPSHGANILLLTPMGSKSHKIFYMGIVNALAEKGHNITIVSAYKSSEAKENIKEVVIPLEDVTGLTPNIFEEEGDSDHLKNMFQQFPHLCSDGLASKEVQDLKAEKYDVVLLCLFFDYCYLSLVHHFQVPFIYLSPVGLIAPFAKMLGSAEFPSIVGHLYSVNKFPLSFAQRFEAIVLNWVMVKAGDYYLLPKMENICRNRGLCPSDMPSFEEFNSKASLAIINSARGLEYPPRPSMPNVIYAGGAHVRPGKPLSEELESWIQEAGEDGFIFFSLGSALNPSNLPEKHRTTLMNVFGSLRQRVLWKWDDENVRDHPSNVKLSKWLPQQDILAHQKLKLFITHGGLLSTFESTYNGVPVLGLPVYADQFGNMRKAAEEGWARVLLWKDLNEKSFKLVIDEILSNSSLQEISSKRSLIMKDTPIHPADEAAFWVEYVIRHEGALHLRSPLFQMSWYKIHNLDVWSILLLSILIIVYISYSITKVFLQLCCHIITNKDKETKISIIKKNK